MAPTSRPSQIKFLNSFPSGKAANEISDPTQSLLIYDEKLAEISSEFAKWSRLYPHRYAVQSGEGLKDVANFSEHAVKLSGLASNLSPRSMNVVSAGGGSVGDFAGFFASVYKRGVGLVHIPTTWLAAIDSSHGGKTALNVGGVKNQIGSFYPASKIALVQSILFHQPQDRVIDAMGELGKIALIDGGEWTKRLAGTRCTGEELLWHFLKPAIEAKMKVVERDPNEQTGHRQILNFGHTIGHVLEAAHGWSHGGSVAQGTFFAIEYSRARGLLTESETQKILLLFESKLALAPFKPEKIPARKFTQLLAQDKKKSASDKVTFIFLKKIGRTVRESVSVKDVVIEARRQGLVR